MQTLQWSGVVCSGRSTANDLKLDGVAKPSRSQDAGVKVNGYVCALSFVAEAKKMISSFRPGELVPMENLHQWHVHVIDSTEHEKGTVPGLTTTRLFEHLLSPSPLLVCRPCRMT